jgi:Putative Ig domain
MRGAIMRLALVAVAACAISVGCAAQQKASGSGTITVSPPAMTLTSSTLTPDQAGVAYTSTLTATGGTAPYSWTATSTLPPGLTLSSAGVLSGTPTAAGGYNITVSVSDSSKPPMTVTGAVSLVITPTTLTLTTFTLSGAQQGVPYTATLSAQGGTPPYTWTITAGALPPGLSLSAAGVISGTPTLAGSYNFTATCTDSGTPAAQVIKKVVMKLPITPSKAGTN